MMASGNYRRQLYADQPRHKVVSSFRHDLTLDGVMKTMGDYEVKQTQVRRDPLDIADIPGQGRNVNQAYGQIAGYHKGRMVINGQSAKYKSKIFSDSPYKIERGRNADQPIANPMQHQLVDDIKETANNHFNRRERPSLYSKFATDPNSKQGHVGGGSSKAAIGSQPYQFKSSYADMTTSPQLTEALLDAPQEGYKPIYGNRESALQS
jgi:hypothetical protein